MEKKSVGGDDFEENGKMKGRVEKRQNPRGERSHFSSSDDNAMLKQIQATHCPDGREFATKPLLHVVEDIFHRAAMPSGFADIAQHQGIHQEPEIDTLDEKTLQNGFFEMLEMLSYTINKISCELTCKCSGGGDAHTTTLSIFNLISGYSWDAKIVLALSAFAVNYGEFWLVNQLCLTNPLAKSVALLKQLPDMLEQSNALKPKFETLNNLMRASLDVAKCIVEFKELPSHYITHDMPEMLTATAHIPAAAYWTIRSIVACASQIIGLIGMGHEYIASTTEAWELSSLAHKVQSIHEHLMKQLTQCYHIIDEKRHIESYQTLIRLFETNHADNMKILRALIYAKDDQLPLYDGHAKRRVSLDSLRRKNVLLYISDLDLPHEELSILEQMYTEARQHPDRIESQYEVVWLPVVDRSSSWNDIKQSQFDTLQSLMPWYSVYHPSLLDSAVIRYIKEVWKFNKEPLVVVLDHQKVVNQNAIHMMWIWGSAAFPFTSLREEALWKEESWRIDLLADAIDPNIPLWIQQGKHICLYGGEDIDWIRKFTVTADALARALGIELEMLYVGKSNPREKIRKNNIIIQHENLSHVLQDLTLIWFFWVRLESMWHSKVQHNRTVENDAIMQEIVTMLSFDGSDQGWAVISKGSGGGGEGQLAKGKGGDMLNCFDDFQSWRQIAEETGFVSALHEYLRGHHNPHHCNRLILPGTTGSIPEMIACAECNRPMEKFFMYRCCTD